MPQILPPSADSNRTLYFHTGTPKTGSTALQVYLTANRDRMGQSGVSYEIPFSFEYSPGNGLHLYGQLFNQTMRDNVLDELLESYLAGRKTGICSFEGLNNFRQDEWNQLKDSSRRLGVDLKFVTFVRDIAPFYVSLHGQLIKAGELPTSFVEFCAFDHYSTVMDSLKCLLRVFGKDAMSVFHYESAIGKMDKLFMGTIGLSPDDYDNSALQTTINRSLTAYELEVVSRVNAATGQQYSVELSNYLMNKRPQLRPAINLDQVVSDALVARHSADIDWLNQTFWCGEPTVKVSAVDSSNKAGEPLTATDRELISRDVTDWCLSKIQSAQDKGIEYVANQLQNIDWKNAGDPLVPSNFDPIAYLILNHDLLKAGIPPFEHFIVAGNKEMGRRLEWPNR